MSYRYGYEEIDYVDGTSDWVWNAPNHVFFLRLRELFDDELCALYSRLETEGCWSAESLIKEFNEWQAQFPEELWRVNTVRLYIRTYTSSFINGPAAPTFLKERANGRKRHQRAQFERGQEKYMASKFRSTLSAAERIYLRCSVPNISLAVAPNYDMHLTPYSHVYLNVEYGESLVGNIRAKPGETYTIPYNGVADIIEIHSAASLQDIGDLSSCYLTNGEFGTASKIQELKLGSDAEGYVNTNTMTLSLGDNQLLRKIDIQNMSGMTQALDLSGLHNLEEIYANGTGISGATFADGGLINTAELPAIGALVMRRLSYLDNLSVSSLANLTSLIAEECNSVDVINILENAPALNRVRITGVDWVLTDTNLLSAIYRMAGFDKDGYNVSRSVLSGSVHVPVIYQQELSDYQVAWPDLLISYDTLVEQHVVTFVNEDGSVLKVQYVIHGEKAGNPGLIPEKNATVSHRYEFARWDKDPAAIQIFGDTEFTAIYNEFLREYTVKYVVMNSVAQETVATYGSYVHYTGEAPVYTAQESAPTYKFYLFNRWDKSGYIDGDKVITAIFDSYQYDGKLGQIDFSDMTPVQIYALTRLYKAGIVALPSEGFIEEGSAMRFTLGSDIDYDDIYQKEIISSPKVFDGTNYIDTGISLFDTDRDFVLAVDYEFASDCKAGGVLMQCLQPITLQGVRLFYNENPRVTWNQTTNTSLSAAGKREILIFRHQAGSNVMKIYNSNITGEIAEISMGSTDGSSVFGNTLTFGAAKANDGIFENFAKGTVYWAKLWYTDMGDTICRDLASWVHEDLTMEICSFRKYALSGDLGQNCSFTLLAGNVLSVTTTWNATNSTAGGFAESKLRSLLNNRIYYAIPTQIRSLLKSVIVSSTIGGNSSEISRSACYIAAPSYSELFNITDEPYINEGSGISYLINAAARRRMDSDGAYQSYWTRSPRIYGSGSNAYVWAVDSTGSALSTSYSYANRENHILIQFSI